MREVRERVAVRVAIDETAAEHGALGAGVADAVCLKISRCGGIGGLLAAATLVRASGAEAYLSSTFDGPLGIAAGVHAAAALASRGPLPHCGLATLGAVRATSSDPLPARDGEDRGADAAPGSAWSRSSASERACRRSARGRPSRGRRTAAVASSASRGHRAISASRASGISAPCAAERAVLASRSPASTVTGIVELAQASHSGAIAPGAEPAQRRRQRTRVVAALVLARELARPRAGRRRTAAACASAR